MNLADETNGIPCKKFFDRPEEAEAVESLKPGTTVKVRGNVRLDKYSGGLVLAALGMLLLLAGSILMRRERDA